MMIDGLNIGEVARRAGIQPSAIRYYESVGLLSAPERIGGWRSYPTEVLDRLRLIRTARGMGFTLEELHILLDGFSDDTPPSERWRSLAAEKLPEVDDLIYRA
ncbi:MAG: MerR family transcriptional regulator, partial [Anaerolineae bacterium]